MYIYCDVWCVFFPLSLLLLSNTRNIRVSVDTSIFRHYPFSTRRKAQCVWVIDLGHYTVTFIALLQQFIYDLRKCKNIQVPIELHLSYYSAHVLIRGSTVSKKITLILSDIGLQPNFKLCCSFFIKCISAVQSPWTVLRKELLNFRFTSQGSYFEVDGSRRTSMELAT